MKELIDLLNHTSGSRVLFYCFVFLAALGIVAQAIVYVIEAIFNRWK